MDDMLTIQSTQPSTDARTLVPMLGSPPCISLILVCTPSPCYCKGGAVLDRRRYPLSDRLEWGFSFRVRITIPTPVLRVYVDGSIDDNNAYEIHCGNTVFDLAAPTLMPLISKIIAVL